MRRLFILIIVIIASFSISAYSLYVDNSGFEAGDGQYLFALRYGRTYIHTPLFESGEIDRVGLLRFVKDPYKAPLSLKARAAKWRKNGNNLGSVIKINNARFFYGGNALGLSVDFDYFESAAFFSLEDKKSDEFQSVYSLSPAFYMLFLSKIQYFNVLLASSVSKNGTFSLFSALSLKMNSYFVELRLGKIEKLEEKSEDGKLSFKLEVDRDIYSASFYMFFGDDAKYSYEYQDFNAEVKQTLKLNELMVSFITDSSISRSGKREGEHKIEGEYRGIKVIYSFDKGYYYRLNLKGASLIYDNGTYGVELKKSISKDDYTLHLALSTKEGFKLSFSMIN